MDFTFEFARDSLEKTFCFCMHYFYYSFFEQLSLGVMQVLKGRLCSLSLVQTSLFRWHYSPDLIPVLGNFITHLVVSHLSNTKTVLLLEIVLNNCESPKYIKWVYIINKPSALRLTQILVLRVYLSYISLNFVVRFDFPCPSH